MSLNPTLLDAGDMASENREIVSTAMSWAVLRFMIVAYVLLSVGNYVTLGWTYLVLDGAINRGVYLSVEQADVVDLSVVILAFAQIFVYVLSIIAYAVFFYKSQKNALEMERAPRELNAHGVYLWFAVPVASWFMPLKRVGEIWATGRGWLDRPADFPAVGWLWWACWVFGGLLSIVEQRLPSSSLDFVPSADTFEQYQLGTGFFFVTQTLFVISAIGLFFVARGIARDQAEIRMSLAATQVLE